MATHSSILVWRIPWTKEPGGLYIVHGVTKSWTRLDTTVWKWVSHRLGPVFFFWIYSNTLCLWIHVFRLLIFEVIIDTVGLISTVFVILSIHCTLFLFPGLFMPLLILIEHFVQFSCIFSLSMSIIFNFFYNFL